LFCSMVLELFVLLTVLLGGVMDTTQREWTQRNATLELYVLQPNKGLAPSDTWARKYRSSRPENINQTIVVTTMYM
jgi:hypothetical protein